MCAAFPSRKLSLCRICAPGLLLKCFVGRSPGQQVSTCFSCCTGINPAMAGGKGKDAFRAESISSVCSLRCCDLWWHSPPRQGSGEDLDGTRRFSSLGKPGGGKETSFSGPWGCGRWGFSSTQNHSDRAGPCGGLAWMRVPRYCSSCRD